MIVFIALLGSKNYQSSTMNISSINPSNTNGNMIFSIPTKIFRNGMLKVSNAKIVKLEMHLFIVYKINKSIANLVTVIYIEVIKR